MIQAERIRVLTEIREMVEKHRREYEEHGREESVMAFQTILDELDTRLTASKNAQRFDGRQ